MTNQKEFIAGAAGGLAGVVTGYPFDTVKGIGVILRKRSIKVRTILY